MSDRRDVVTRALEDAAQLLPGQAPLGAFVHHNTLHVLEDLDFHAAVRRAHDLFGARAYLPDATFRRFLAEGRICPAELDAAIDADPSLTTQVISGIRRRDVLLAALLEDLGPRGVAEIEYARLERGGETESESCRLWRHCLTVAPRPEVRGTEVPVRDRDALLAATAVDTDEILHPVLIQLLGAFLDAGLAYWPMPHREEGFYKAVRALELTRSRLPAPWMRGVHDAFARQAKRGAAALDVVCDHLEALGVGEASTDDFFKAQLLALPGWSGMMWHLETHPHHRLRQDVPCSLMDYLAVRLTLEQFAVKSVAKAELDIAGRRDAVRSLAWARVAPPGGTNDVNADRLLRLVVAVGMPPAQIEALTDSDAIALLSTLDEFDEPARGAVWQEAFEQHHRHEVLDGLAHVARKQRQATPSAPQLQLVCCIDDREESLRRHFEELSGEYETFGTAGYYGLSIDYQGLMAGHASPLCPASMRPTHRVFEVPDEGEDVAAWRQRWAMLSQTGFAGHVGSRTMLRGLGLSIAGVLEAGPMLLRTLAPRAAHRWRTWVREAVIRAPRTRLTALREPDRDGADGLPVGYTIEEAVEALAGIFVGMGLTSRFAPLVIVLGHGSTSMNNPHEAAHECGACSGNKGGANGRLFAQLANDPSVREGLARRGVSIPLSTWFVGGIHDTSNDAVDLADRHHVPATHATRLQDAIAALDAARTLDAHERCRRFESVSLAATPLEALHHVQGRAQFHGEPRPEYGHCTNAICLVGRRWLQRGLFLDRRAFLVSYDPALDADGSVLQKLLASVGPVGAGINLEYYFSTVDQQQYGCGTKLPHNVAGLVGVVNGHRSDLRTGLPYQMVDIHEPVRLLTVVEATPDRLEAIARQEPGVGRLVTHRWIQLVAMDPTTLELWELKPAGFERYVPRPDAVTTHKTSAEYYGGHRHHLPPAAIEAGL